MSAATVAQTASNAYAPARPAGFKPPGPLATFASDVNMLLSGAALFAAGVGLIAKPVETVAFLRPALGLIETHLGGREGLSIGALAVGKGAEPGLSLLGCALAFTGYLFLMGVYTLDEKLKRNATPGRLIAAFGSFYVCTKTQHGTSLHALLGIFLAVGGVANAFAVGLGDGNAVDLEDKERRRVALVARERRETEKKNKVE